jgi:hypothetical protein
MVNLKCLGVNWYSAVLYFHSMKPFRPIIPFILCMFCCVNPMTSQPLIFSSDTAVQASCEHSPMSFESHWIYNNTDEDIVLKWQRTYYQHPDESYYLMIINGGQYPYFSSQGTTNLYAHDSIFIIFDCWREMFVPGDSVIVQIIVYDQAEGMNEAQTLTMIQYCPLQTGNTETQNEIQLRVFPNPVYQEATIYIPETKQISLIDLYSLTGKHVRQIPVTESEISFSRDDLPGGMYILTAVKDGRTVWMTKVVLIE